LRFLFQGIAGKGQGAASIHICHPKPTAVFCTSPLCFLQLEKPQKTIKKADKTTATKSWETDKEKPVKAGFSSRKRMETSANGTIYYENDMYSH